MLFIHISDLVIEVTRRCNMSCSHCLRGDPQNKNINFEYIDCLLNQINSIGVINFTGGEPSLNVAAMEYFLKVCKEKNISIDAFYIVTNGKTISEDFILFCLRLFSYCQEKEYCQVVVSNDYYHAVESNYDTELLDGLSFFARKYTKEQYNYDDGKGLLYQGFSEEGQELEEFEIKTLEDFEQQNIYLNCKGNIINGSNWSYENQEKNILCQVKDLTEYINSLEE